jgi:hypothetical protein
MAERRELAEQQQCAGAASVSKKKGVIFVHVTTVAEFIGGRIGINSRRVMVCFMHRIYWF